MINSIIDSINYLGNLFSSFYQTIVNVFSYIVSIFGFLFYAGKTLIIGVYKLILEVINGGVFSHVFDSFESLSYYIGSPAVFFFTSLLFLIFIRIIIGFIFKIFRLNVDYKKDKDK